MARIIVDDVDVQAEAVGGEGAPEDAVGVGQSQQQVAEDTDHRGRYARQENFARASNVGATGGRNIRAVGVGAVVFDVAQGAGEPYEEGVGVEALAASTIIAVPRGIVFSRPALASIRNGLELSAVA